MLSPADGPPSLLATLPICPGSYTHFILCLGKHGCLLFSHTRPVFQIKNQKNHETVDQKDHWKAQDGVICGFGCSLLIPVVVACCVCVVLYSYKNKSLPGRVYSLNMETR